MTDEFATYQRMTRCLLAIRDLDPDGVDARLIEVELALGRLQAAIGREPGMRASTVDPRPAELVTAA